jgi:uncharacterized repeat protein (TIGR03803 family)
MRNPLFTTLAIFVALGVAHAASSNIVYSFAGDEDGEYADSELALDASGNIYGTTVQGGDFSAGTVFQITPSGAHTVLYSFTGGGDGGEPYKGVVIDSQGNLYGTTVVGGLSLGPCIDSGCGVVYKVSQSGGKWTQSVIYSFTGGDDGFGPGGALVFDSHGNLDGMTPTGGANGLGTVFQLQPTASGPWQLRLLHTFAGGNDGATGSAGRLLIGPKGDLFGVATAGGVNGAGTVFGLTPVTQGEWTSTTLYSFQGLSAAGFPYGGLVFDGQGSFFGTTYYDGANDLGTIYRLEFQHGAWHESTVHNFAGGADGSGPIATLAADASGNLYGTTSEGGTACSCGTIFKLTRMPHRQWAYSVVYRFRGAPDGAFPYNGLILNSSGTFFGATTQGGASDEGAIYQFTP